MAGPFSRVSRYKQNRISELTLRKDEDLSAPVIAERLGLKTSQVHYYQKKFGLRKVKHRRDENE